MTITRHLMALLVATAPEKAEALRDVLAVVRGDVRKSLNEIREALDETLIAERPDYSARKVGKRWRIKPVERESGRGFGYIRLEARRGNPLATPTTESAATRPAFIDYDDDDDDGNW
jgi:hypothetical protein